MALNSAIYSRIGNQKANRIANQNENEIILTNQIAEKYRAKTVILGGNVAISVAKFPPFQIKMDEFNYLQFFNDDNDLLVAEQLLADDFPTFDVSFNQMVATFLQILLETGHISFELLPVVIMFFFLEKKLAVNVFVRIFSNKFESRRTCSIN